MRLYAYRVIVKFKTPLVGKVIREEPMLVYACDRGRAARIATEFHTAKKVEGELPFIDVKEIVDCGPVGEGMS